MVIVGLSVEGILIKREDVFVLLFAIAYILNIEKREEQKYLRVVTLADGETIHNGMFDRTFARRTR